MLVKPATWIIEKDGEHLGTVLAQSKDEALGKATVKYGTSRYPYEAHLWSTVEGRKA